MLESMNAIQQSIKEMNLTLQYLNQRITKIEKQVGIKTPIPLNTEQNLNKNNNNLIITTQQTNTTQQNDNRNENVNIWRRPVNIYNKNTSAKPNYQRNDRTKVFHNKRQRIVSLSSESEGENSNHNNKGKNVSFQNLQENSEINEVKATQKSLAQQVTTIGEQLASLISMFNANK